MDLTGRDCCDLAFDYGIEEQFEQLNKRQVMKKVIPMLPDGTHAELDQLPFYLMQQIDLHEKMDEGTEYIQDKIKKMCTNKTF